MLPYLVKNLKFLQNGVLKVSGDYLDRGNWSRGGPTSSVKSARQSSQQLAAFEQANQAPPSLRYATGHQPFLQVKSFKISLSL